MKHCGASERRDDRKEAHDLAIVLRAGALPATVKIVQNITVGPTLGADSIKKGLTAGLIGTLLVVLVAATDFPAEPAMAAWVIGLFILVRLLDEFLYMPLTIGKSLHMHPLVAVLMIFIGGALAGISGLMLALPVLGIVMVVGEAIGAVVTDSRLMARYRYARALRKAQASVDL